MGRYRNPFSIEQALVAFVFVAGLFFSLSSPAGALVMAIFAYLILQIVSAIGDEDTDLSLSWWLYSYLVGSSIASAIFFITPSLWVWILDVFGPTVGTLPFLSLFFSVAIGYLDIVSKGTWSPLDRYRRIFSLKDFNSIQKKKTEAFDVRTDYLEGSGELEATYVANDESSYPPGRAQILVNGEVRHEFEPASENRTVRLDVSEDDSVTVRKNYGY